MNIVNKLFHEIEFWFFKRLPSSKLLDLDLLALPTKKARISCFRFIIEYSSFKGFWSLGNNNRSIFYMRIFER
jgi:hypothetical protein